MTHALPLWTIAGPPRGSLRWLGSLSLVLLLSLVLIVAGCSFSSFVAAAEADLPVVIQMISNITAIAAPGIALPIQAGGSAAIAALQIACGTPAPGATKCDPTSLVGQYQAATDAAVK